MSLEDLGILSSVWSANRLQVVRTSFILFLQEHAYSGRFFRYASPVAQHRMVSCLCVSSHGSGYLLWGEKVYPRYLLRHGVLASYISTCDFYTFSRNR